MGASVHEPLIAPVDGFTPEVDPEAFVAPTAVLLGRVRVGARSSIWYASVLRGDDDWIEVGCDCNVQDGSVLHADEGLPAVLGDRVSLGHRAIVHGARVADDVLIGMNATVLNGAQIGSGSLIAAGAVVRPGMEIPPGSLVTGVPATIRRPVNDRERAMIAHTTRSYVARIPRHRAVGSPATR